MQAADGRMLNLEAFYEQHRQIVLAFKQGCNEAMISRDMGVSYSAICMSSTLLGQ